MRNYIHIVDVIRGFEFVLDNFDKMNYNIYNLGNDLLNCSKGDLSKQIQKNLPKITIKSTVGNDPDKRNYIVSSQKIYDLGYQPLYGLNYGINELVNYYSYLPKDKTEREKIIQYMRNDKFVAEADK